MQVAIRKQMLAGFASVAVVGTMVAVAPAVPPLDLPNIQTSMVRTAAFANGFVENAAIIVGGFAASFSAIQATLPNALAAPSQVIGGFQRDTDQIPIIVGDVFRGFDTQITGVAPVQRPEPNPNSTPSAPLPPGSQYDAGTQFPGYYEPTDGTPAGPSVLAGPIVAVDKVAQNLVDAHVPGAHTLQAVTVSTRKVGVTVVQAQGLVRTSAFEAVNSTYQTAYNGGTPQQVVNAAAAGVQHFGQSITGDPTAPTGTVRKLGAIGSVAKSVSDSVKAVGAGVKKDVDNAAGGGA